MNIEYIEDFIKVAEYNSLNRASSFLNISTPALSKRIKHIEAYFNCDLFYRTPQGIFLTRQGELVLATLKSIEKELDNVKLSITNHTNEKLRIGLIPSFSLYKWVGQKKTLIDENISVTIESNTQNLLHHLQSGTIDVIIGDMVVNENNQFYHEVLYREKYMVVFPKKSKLSSYQTILDNDLTNEALLLLNPPCDTLSFIQRQCSNHKLNIKHKNDIESILANVKIGQGITIIPQSLSSQVADMNLLMKPLDHHTRDIGLLSLSKEKLQEAIHILKS